MDLGEAKRGHEQRGRRYGLVLSPAADWNVATSLIRSAASIRPASMATPFIT
jgi:mRNA interferase MazF